MATRNVALAAVIGVLVAAGSLVAAPVAKADCAASELETCWGALAASPSNGHAQIITNERTQQKAEDAAVLQCNVLGETNDCQVVRSGPGCLALASSADKKTYAGRVEPTLEAADAEALDGAGPGSTILVNGCNA